MEITKIFGTINDAQANDEGRGYLTVHLYDGSGDCHVWFNNLAQLGDLEFGDSVSFDVLPLNNKALSNSYQWVSRAVNPNTIDHKLNAGY